MCAFAKEILVLSNTYINLFLYSNTRLLADEVISCVLLYSRSDLGCSVGHVGVGSSDVFTAPYAELVR